MGRRIGIALVGGLIAALLFTAGNYLSRILYPVKGHVYFPNMLLGFFYLTLIFSIAVFITLEIFVFKRMGLVKEKLRLMRAKKVSSPGKDVLADLEKEVNGLAEERREEKEHLKKLEDYRKEFLGNVSHELKTPIFNIQGYIHTLLDGGVDDPKINKDYLVRAANSVDRMIAIVDDLQAITQFESGELVLEQERFDIIALIKDVFDAQELKAKERKITFELVGDPREAMQVKGDRFRIRQVLVNLVVNSVRYGKEGGHTQVRVHDLGDKARIEVGDNGIGISKAHLPRIFERFYRADKSRSREMGGTGLGLAIVKHIIEGHGQTIEVMSTEGAGSVFSFTLKKAG
jgi:two-component system, OmpR family, phosphate regulon sensor histidine kinase PhoR